MAAQEMPAPFLYSLVFVHIPKEPPMKHILFSLITFLSLVAFTEPLKLDMDSWHGNPLTWQSIPNGFKTIATGHTLEYVHASLTENAEIEAVVTVEKRLMVSYAVIGVGLVQNASNFYHLALVEKPLATGAGHHIELHQRQQDKWPKSSNLETVAVESPDMNWQYNVPYHLKLTKNADTITGTVTTLDGKLCYKRIIRFKPNNDDTPVNYVRPALRNDLAIATYTDLNGSGSGQIFDDSTKPSSFPPYHCNSFVKDKKTTPTGFFQVKQDADGSWLAYDPLGRGFFVLGMGSVTYNGQMCERLQNKQLYRANNEKKYKSVSEWEDETLARLTSWGFNSFYGDNSLLQMRGLSSQRFLSVGTSMASLGDEFDITPYERRPCSAFPNVYHPQFRKWCEWRIESLCGQNVNNPWIFGYFTDNELAWWGRGATDTGLFDAAMKKSAVHHAKIAIKDLLLKHANGSLAELNKTWGLKLENANELLEMTSLPSATEKQKEIKLAFLRQTAETYFRTIHDAFRKIDPNHLLLGCRFAGIPRNHPVVWEEAGKYSDVVTWNSYIMVDMEDGIVYSDLTRNRRTMVDTFKEAYSYAQKPIMITEWSFPALDSGLPCTHGAGQRYMTQAERAKATDIYARTLLSLPFAIGFDYFMWVDQPPLGVSLVFPENTNYGIVNIKGEPYPLMVDVFKKINANPAACRLMTHPQANPVPQPKNILYNTLCASPMRGDAPNKAFTINRRAPLDFDVSNGRLRIETRPNDNRLYFSLDGKPVATYSAMLHYINKQGKQRWAEAKKLTSAEIQADSQKLVITLTADSPDQKPADDDASFSITYRLVITPDTPWMLWDVQSVTNTGNDSINVKSIFLRSFPNFDNKREICDDTTYHHVPNLWSPIKYGGWTKPDLSMTVCFAADFRSNTAISCRHDVERNGFYPDLRSLDETVIQPGGRFSPPTPFCILALVTQGTLQDALPAAIGIWK